MGRFTRNVAGLMGRLLLRAPLLAVVAATFLDVGPEEDLAYEVTARDEHTERDGHRAFPRATET